MPLTVQAAEEWKEATQYLRVDAGYTFEDISFTNGAGSEFQRLVYGDRDHYELRVTLGYLNKFDEQAFTFAFGGSYNLLKPLRLSLDAGFAPGRTVAARQDYAIRAEETVWEKIIVGVHYQFQDFAQANLHHAGPIVGLKFGDRLKLLGTYEVSQTNQGSAPGLLTPPPSSFINHAAAVRADLQVVSVLSLHASYGRSSHNFEAGAPDNPFKSYTSNDLGAGLRFQYLMGNGLFFDFTDEERDNAQTIRTYTLGTFLDF